MKTGQTFIASLALVPLFLTGSVVPAHQDASQDPRFTVELAPDPVDEFYGYVFTITNQSRVPISAVIIACGTSPSESGAPRYVYLYEDNAFGMAEIPYLESGNFEVHRPESWGYIQMSCNQDTSVKAILFADGSSFGESEWAEKILHMRAYALQTLAERMSYLQAAKNSGIRKRQLRDELMKLSRQEDTVKCSDPLPCALGDPVSYIALWRDLPPDRDYPADAPVTQALVDDLVEPYLDLRQRLIYSKPRLPGIPQDLNPARAPLPDFTIKIPSGLGADDDSIGNMITLIYTLSAKGQKDKFLHDWFDPPKKPYTLSIEPMIAGHQATGLQVAMYAPGCQIKLIDIPDLSTYSGSENFECVKLPTLNFTGQVLSSYLLEGKRYSIKIELYNSGDDGSPYFNIYLEDEVIADEHGIFHIEIPDFSQDPACVSSGAVLQFSATTRGVAQGLFAKLVAADGAANSDGDLRPMTSYGGVVTFHAIPMPH